MLLKQQIPNNFENLKDLRRSLIGDSLLGMAYIYLTFIITIC